MTEDEKQAALIATLGDGFGKHIGRGIVHEILQAVFWVFLFSLILVAVGRCAGYPARDETDAAHGPRSGFDLRTDHGTGCQYLQSRQGSVTPRLGRDGRQVCR